MTTPIEDFEVMLPKSYIFAPSQANTFHRMATINGTANITLPTGVYRVQVSWNGTQRLSMYTKPKTSVTGEYTAVEFTGAESVSQSVTGLADVVSDDGTGYVRVSATATSTEMTDGNVRAKVTIIPMGIVE